jgi:hypothetical protein
LADSQEHFEQNKIKKMQELPLTFSLAESKILRHWVPLDKLWVQFHYSKCQDSCQVDFLEIIFCFFRFFPLTFSRACGKIFAALRAAGHLFAV